MKGITELFGRATWRLLGSRRVPSLVPVFGVLGEMTADPRAAGWRLWGKEQNGHETFTIFACKAPDWRLAVSPVATDSSLFTQRQRFSIEYSAHNGPYLPRFELVAVWPAGVDTNHAADLQQLTLHVNKVATRHTLGRVRWTRENGVTVEWPLRRTGDVMTTVQPIIGDNWWANDDELMRAYVCLRLPPHIMAATQLHT